MSSKKLGVEKLIDLNRWLAARQINTNKLHRDFSDALPVAKLLKSSYPKLIDLHNYPSCSNTHLKLDSWQTFNSKVLRKLGLQQSNSNLEKIAKCTPGVIECLLYDIMVQERSLNKPNEYEEDESVDEDVITINVPEQVGGEIKNVPRKMISFSIYEQTVQECKLKDAYLAVSQEKIALLQPILNVKSAHVAELCSQVALLSVSNLIKQDDEL